MDDNEVIVDILNHILACNVSGAEWNDKWKDVITEFFCKPADTDDEDDDDGEDDEEECDDDFEPDMVLVDVVQRVETNNELVFTDSQDMELEKVKKFR